MTKMSDTKMTLSLDSESKRLLRNLTKAIDRLARTKYDETGGVTGVKRLKEPAEDGNVPYARGGYVKPDPPLTEPKGYVDPKFGARVELDPVAIQNLPQSVLNQKGYLQ